MVALKSEQSSAVDGLVEGILTEAHNVGSNEIEACRKPLQELRKLACIDYVRIIRRTLDYQVLRAIICESARIWPQLNRERVWPQPIDELVGISSDLRIHLQAAPYPGPEGMALRGFYVDRVPKMLTHPLIFLNTAHHPSAVSTTFIHEIGHHVIANVAGRAGGGVNYFFSGAHHNHVGNPAELTADVLVSLAVYPEPLARRIFAMPWEWGLVARADELPDQAFAQIRKHVQKFGGTDFGDSLTTGQCFNHLTRMIHYAKLRWALLLEYDL